MMSESAHMLGKTVTEHIRYCVKCTQC